MSSPGAARARILLVDDSVLMRKAAGKMLGDEFDIVTASDGMEAWITLQNDSAIQVVFTDLSMPRLDGFGLLERIRTAEDEGTTNMPVIIVTGADDDESARRRALDRGATDFITKPFTSVDLLARARAHANYRRIAKRLEQQSTRDALTGLLNKAGFLDRAQQDLAYTYRHGQPLSLARLEIDDFRGLFLRFGKSVAEEIVQQVASTIRASIREEDSVGRVGLSGFAVCLPAGQFEGSKGLVERVRQQIAMGEGNSIAVTVSAAVLTPALERKPDAAELLAGCEALLQEALAAGGNRISARCDLPSGPEAELEWGSAGSSPAAQESDDGGFDVRRMAALLTAAGTDAQSPAAAPDAPPPALVPSPVAPVPSDGPTQPPAQPMPRPDARAPVEALGVDAALGLLGRGQAGPVVSQLPQLVRRLLPLFRLLSARQRAQLVDYLQKLRG